MSRLQTRSSGGRPVSVPSAKNTRARDSGNETYEEPAIRRRRYARRTGAKSSRVEPPSDAVEALEGDDSASEGADGDDEEDDISNDDDEPDYQTPSHVSRRHKAGHYDYSDSQDNLSEDNLSSLGDFDFDPYFEGDDGVGLLQKQTPKLTEQPFVGSEDDEDDGHYRKVDDISDSEDDDAATWALDELRLLTGPHHDKPFAHLNENPELFSHLNEIDGMSAFGFGESDDIDYQFVPSSQDSDSLADEEKARRVHFATDLVELVPLRFSDSSPVLGRALLPSALPETEISRNGNDLSHNNGGDEAYDSDATEDCLPAEAQLANATVTPEYNGNDGTMAASALPTKSSTKKKQQRLKGPPSGFFFDDGDKPSGILDSTGKIMLVTNPHLLGEEFAKRYGASHTSSPDIGFAEIIEGSEHDDTPSSSAIPIAADTMLTTLAGARRGSAGNGVGSAEALFPAEGFNVADYLAFDDLEAAAHFDDMDAGEHLMRLEDVISFGDGETEDEDSALPPIYMPPLGQDPAFDSHNDEVRRLTRNVAAFRRHADSTHAALSNTPRFQDFSMMVNPLTTPPAKRKRKSDDSPYNHSHYAGVTPVHRMRASDHPESQVSAAEPATKKRRMMN